MSLRDFIKKRSAKGEVLKEMIEQRRLEKMADDRMKSPQEREIEAFLERERQEKMKQKLVQIHDMERRKIFSGGLMDKKNIFKGHNNLLHTPSNFKVKSSLLNKSTYFK